MTRDEVVQILGWRLGDRSDMAERIIAEMKFVQRSKLEQREWLPWFLETELAVAETTVGEARVELPDDFLGEIEEQHLWIELEAGQPTQELIKMEYDEAKRRFPEPGVPVAYAVTGKYLHLFPTPLQVYQLSMRYYAADADMAAANVETLWLKYAPDLVIAEVGELVARKHIQNGALADSFAKDAVVALATLYARHTARQEVNMERALGGRT